MRALEKRERGYLTPVTHWRASAVLITGGTQPGAAEGRGFQMERRANTLFRNATRCPPPPTPPTHHHPPTHLGTTWRAFVEVVVKLEAEASWENGYIQLQLPKKKEKKKKTHAYTSQNVHLHNCRLMCLSFPLLLFIKHSDANHFRIKGELIMILIDKIKIKSNNCVIYRKTCSVRNVSELENRKKRTMALSNYFQFIA